MIYFKAATVDDLPVIRDLAYTIWPHAYRSILSQDQLDYMLELIYALPALQQQMLSLKHQFTLVLNDGLIIGFASFSAKGTTPTTYHLHKIYLSPELQGTGNGKLLLQHVINSAKAAGAVSLELNVNRNNKARDFYEKQGFSIIREEDIDIGHGYFMNDFVMSLPLNK
ncbi:MAG: GNAT family N-acetyltransferase [Ginsengibacter sp.]